MSRRSDKTYVAARSLAQVEHGTFNAGVLGSIPQRAALFHFFPSRSTRNGNKPMSQLPIKKSDEDAANPISHSRRKQRFSPARMKRRP